MKKTIIALIVFSILVFSLNSFAGNSYKVTGVANINTASKVELMMVPGLGEAKAASILKQRGQKGFSALEDLLVVRGIGEKLLHKISPYLVTKGVNTIKKTKLDAKTKG